MKCLVCECELIGTETQFGTCGHCGGRSLTPEEAARARRDERIGAGLMAGIIYGSMLSLSAVVVWLVMGLFVGWLGAGGFVAAFTGVGGLIGGVAGWRQR